jgi:hypothetical protein
MALKRLIVAALLTVALAGCCCRDRPGLLARLCGQKSATYRQQCPCPTAQPCGCEQETGAPVIYDGGITRPPNVQELPIQPQPLPPAPPLPGDQARPNPAEPSKGSEMNRQKAKSNEF